MNKIKRFITARGISLGLILVLAGLMYISTLVPQRIDSTPAAIEIWRLGHSGMLWLVDAASLHGIYAQPWFALIILCAALSLGVSSSDQLAAARKKLNGTVTSSADEVAASVSGKILEYVARSRRYQLIGVGSGEQLKFVKNPWGYFGVFLLHIGMTLVILVSLFVSLTSRQGALILIEGEQRDQRQSWNAHQHGLLASPLELPGIIRLDKVRVLFDKKDQPLEVHSDISFTDQAGRVEILSASINRILRFRNFRIYHAARYGDAFNVTFTDAAGVSHVERIMVQQAPDLTRAGYSDDFNVTWSSYLFDAKYFADADRKSMQSGNPELVMRMLDGKRELARTSLTRGVPAALAEYRVQFDRAGKWSQLIFVDINGMSAIFAGFAIIMLGGVIHYMIPPRELIGIRQQDGCYRVYWRAVSFREFYLEERGEVAAELEKGVV